MSISNDILHEYLQVSRHISGKFRIFYNKLDLTYPQSIVLAILEADGPMPISALAEAAGSANSTISGVVDRLEKMNLVERIRSETDRRVIYVATTAHFQEQYTKLSNSAADQFADALRCLSDAEQQTVKEGLTLFRRAMSSEDN